ncbi:MAG: class I SAM-dependent methyltransferase [Candidatus Kapaibacteriota bacterium]
MCPYNNYLYNVEVKSPISGKFCNLVEEFIPRKIVLAYKEQYNVNIEYLFKSIDKIFLFECPDTNLLFFYPPNIEGDSTYYQKLSEIPWYYMDWKWEHQIAFEEINTNSTVLEIGFGKGSFLRQLLNKNCKVFGLEKTPVSTKENSSGNLNLFFEDIQTFANKFAGFFDYICAFQTLEHVSDVRNFIQNSLQLLKPKGTLIFSVPNQDSFISLDPFNIFDMPPHHLTRWRPIVFEKICNYFPMKLLKIIFEPLQTHHIEWFKNLIKTNFKNAKLVDALCFAAERFPSRFRGHTILGVFQKTGT